MLQLQFRLVFARFARIIVTTMFWAAQGLYILATFKWAKLLSANITDWIDVIRIFKIKSSFASG